MRLSHSDLALLASKLGADVPFFIYQGTALVGGKGEKITPLPPLPKSWFVLLVPPIPVIRDKTRKVYGKLNASHFTKGQFVHTALLALIQRERIDTTLMFNVFESVAFDFFPDLARYKKNFEEAGSPDICLAGSGPCLFTLVPEEEKANELYSRLRDQKLECYVASSIVGDS